MDATNLIVLSWFTGVDGMWAWKRCASTNCFWVITEDRVNEGKQPSSKTTQPLNGLVYLVG